MGQLYEQMPHWTQRAVSGTTKPPTRASRRVLSCLSRLRKLMIYLITISIWVAFQTTLSDVKDIFLSMMFFCFILIMTSIAGPVPIGGWMAEAAFIIRPSVVGWETVREGGTAPRGCIVAL